MSASESAERIKCQCCSHIETSQLIYTANQLTGFYMRATLALNGFNSTSSFFCIGPVSCLLLMSEEELLTGSYDK